MIINGCNSSSPFHAVERAKQEGLLRRIWNVVVQFFKIVAEKIKLAAGAIGRTIKNCFVKKKEGPPVIQKKSKNLLNSAARVKRLAEPNDAVLAKLAAYDDMPKDHRLFLQRAVDIARETLARKDRKAAQGGLPPQGLNGKICLVTFDEQVNDNDAAGIQKTMQAAIRAFMFSDGNYCPTYLHKHFERGADNRVKEFDYNKKIRRLRERFDVLDNDVKEIILDEFAPEEMDQLHLPAPGMLIMKDITAFALELIKSGLHVNDTASDAFMQAFKTLRIPEVSP